MGKVSYSNLKLKTDTSVNTFTFKEQEIEVQKYLPIEDKYDLIMITLQKANENGLYNALKVDMYFHLYIVEMYTNITFTDKQKENETKLYDCLKSCGLIDAVIKTMEDDEYNFLFEMINQIIDETYKYKNSAGGVLQALITDLPRNAEAAAAIVDNFDPTKYQAVIDFAEAANGNRPISGPNKNKSE